MKTSCTGELVLVDGSCFTESRGLLEAMPARSKSAPLTNHLDLHDVEESNDPSVVPFMWKEFSILNKTPSSNLHRVELLELKGRIPHAAFYYLKTSLRAPAPIFRDLRIAGTSPRSSIDISPDFLGCQSVRLRVVELGPIRNGYIAPALSGLTSLQLLGELTSQSKILASCIQLLDVLERSPELETLKTHLLLPRATTPYFTSARRIALPRLESIEIADYPSTCAFVLDAPDTPLRAQTHLSVYQHEGSEADYDYLYSMISRKWAPQLPRFRTLIIHVCRELDFGETLTAFYASNDAIFPSAHLQVEETKLLFTLHISPRGYPEDFDGTVEQVIRTLPFRDVVSLNVQSTVNTRSAWSDSLMPLRRIKYFDVECMADVMRMLKGTSRSMNDSDNVRAMSAFPALTHLRGQLTWSIPARENASKPSGYDTHGDLIQEVLRFRAENGCLVEWFNVGQCWPPHEGESSVRSCRMSNRSLTQKMTNGSSWQQPVI